MIFGRRGKDRLLEAVAGFEAAVRDRDGARSERGIREMHRHFADAADHEVAQAGLRLTALLPQVPAEPRGLIAVIVGACVERGAQARQCAPDVFDGLAEALASAGEFCARWEATGGGDLPEPRPGDPDPAVAARAGREAAAGWWTLPQWEMASVAMLNDPSVRTGMDDGRRTELLAAVRSLRDASGHDFKCLEYALLVLDDEPLVVLHRPSGTGYALRMSGIGDNFQLHTLLADVLVGGGHVPGRAPSAREAAVCRDAPGQVPTTGAFNLVTPAGQWVWNEGTPADIPVVEGSRLLVLDPPPYERGWPAGRFFPGMSADVVLERVMDEDEARGWFAHCVDAR